MKKLLLTLAAVAATAAIGTADNHVKLDPAKATAKVSITGNDTMQYDKKEFTVKSGEVVALTFKNIGKLPKVAMGHNVVILKKDADMIAFATAAAQNMPVCMPKDEKLLEGIIANTKILGPGESETIVFKAPEAGVYTYICSFPGHFAVMQGKMTVK